MKLLQYEMFLKCLPYLTFKFYICVIRRSHFLSPVMIRLYVCVLFLLECNGFADFL